MGVTLKLEPAEHLVTAMPKLILDVSVSLDGFSAGPNVGVGSPMGTDGEVLHRWLFENHSLPSAAADRQIAGELFTSCGSVITGRRTFDVGIDLWGEDGAFGMPCFVLTHRPAPPLVRGPTTFHFVSDGPRAALQVATVAAGAKDIWLMGAADIARQFLREGLVDEIRVHIVPVLLGAGSHLFNDHDMAPRELQVVTVTPSPLATHITYRVVKPDDPAR